MCQPLPASRRAWFSALHPGGQSSPLISTSVRTPWPIWKLLELNTVDFLPSCNVLTLFKHGVNYSWDLKRNKYSYIHSSQWGVYKRAQKNTFSVKGSTRQEVFCWRGAKILEGCFRHFYKLYSYSRKALSKEVMGRVTWINPWVILSQWQANKTIWVGAVGVSDHWSHSVSVNFLPGEGKKLPFLVYSES